MARTFITIISLTCWLTVAILSQKVYHPHSVQDSIGWNGNQPNPTLIQNIGCAMENGNGCNVVQKKYIWLPRRREIQRNRFGVRGDKFIRLGRGDVDKRTIQFEAEYLSFIEILLQLSTPIQRSVKNEKSAVPVGGKKNSGKDTLRNRVIGKLYDVNGMKCLKSFA